MLWNTAYLPENIKFLHLALTSSKEEVIVRKFFLFADVQVQGQTVDMLKQHTEVIGMVSKPCSVLCDGDFLLAENAYPFGGLCHNVVASSLHHLHIGQLLQQSQQGTIHGISGIARRIGSAQKLTKIGGGRIMVRYPQETCGQLQTACRRAAA